MFLHLSMIQRGDSLQSYLPMLQFELIYLPLNSNQSKPETTTRQLFVAKHQGKLILFSCGELSSPLSNQQQQRIGNVLHSLQRRIWLDRFREALEAINNDIKSLGRWSMVVVMMIMMNLNLQALQHCIALGAIPISVFILRMVRF